MNAPIYLKTTELAKRLRVHRQTIRNWKNQGKITPAISYGRVIRYEWTQVLKEIGCTSMPNHPSFETVQR